MNNEQDLISKLMISKKIMEKHNTMGRGNAQHTTIERPEVETYEAPSAKYNLPEEYIQETTYTPKNTQPVTEDRIMSSKLPDEIKKLMIEHPINQPSHTTSPTLSNELVDKAATPVFMVNDPKKADIIIYWVDSKDKAMWKK